MTAAAQSLNRSIFWALSGNGIYVLCQFAMFFAIAQLTTSADLGRFGFAAALSSSIFMFTNLGLRVGQSSDSAHSFSFGEYLGLRSWGSLVGTLVTLSVGFFIAPDLATFYVICAITAARIGESYSDLCYGVFQKNSRLDQVARSMILRGGLSVVAFVIALWLSRDLALSLITQVIVWALVAALHDYPLALAALPKGQSKRPLLAPSSLVPLARLSLPLGGGAFLAHLITTAPRFIVESFFGLAALGYFTGIAYIYQTGQFFVSAVGQALIARFSQLNHAKNRRGLYQLVFGMAATLMVLGVIATGLGSVLGEWALITAFGAEFAGQSDLLTIMLAALTLLLGAAILQTAITSLRKFKSFAFINAILLPANLAFCIYGAKTLGLNGIGYGILATTALQLVITLMLFIYSERRQYSRNEQP